VLIIVIFSGFAVFTRHNAIWTTLPDSWGLSVAPWVTIGAILLLGVFWLARNNWSFHVPLLRLVDITNGAAPPLGPEKEKSTFEKVLYWILDTLRL